MSIGTDAAGNADAAPNEAQTTLDTTALVEKHREQKRLSEISGLTTTNLIGIVLKRIQLCA